MVVAAVLLVARGGVEGVNRRATRPDNGGDSDSGGVQFP